MSIGFRVARVPLLTVCKEDDVLLSVVRSGAGNLSVADRLVTRRGPGDGPLVKVCPCRTRGSGLKSTLQKVCRDGWPRRVRLRPFPRSKMHGQENLSHKNNSTRDRSSNRGRATAPGAGSRRGTAAAGADLGAALLPDAGPAHQAAPPGRLRPRRPPRRHRRALVRLDHAGRQRGGPADEGLSYVVHEGKRVSLSGMPSTQEGKRLVGPAIWEHYSAGRSTASSSTISDRSRTTCTRATSRPPRSVSRVSRSRTIFHPN